MIDDDDDTFDDLSIIDEEYVNEMEEKKKLNKEKIMKEKERLQNEIEERKKEIEYLETKLNNI